MVVLFFKIFILRVVGFLGKLGIVNMFLVRVIIKLVFVFGINLWIVILKLVGVLSKFGLLEKLYCVFVI